MYEDNQRKLQKIYASVKPGKNQRAVVCIGWNDRVADSYYHLIGWNTAANHWQYIQEGDKAWAERIAKHYDLKIVKKPKLVQ